MTYLRRRLSLLFKLLATGSLSMLLSACYGVVVAMYGVPYRLTGGVRVQTADKLPLPEIKVSYRQWPVSSPEPTGWTALQPTDQNGLSGYYLDPDLGENLRLRLEDADGPANGGNFLPQEVLVDEQEELVILDPAP